MHAQTGHDYTVRSNCENINSQRRFHIKIAKNGNLIRNIALSIITKYKFTINIKNSKVIANHNFPMYQHYVKSVYN